MRKETLLDVKQKDITEYEVGWVIADATAIIDIWKCIKNSKKGGDNHEVST